MFGALLLLADDATAPSGVAGYVSAASREDPEGAVDGVLEVDDGGCAEGVFRGRRPLRVSRAPRCRTTRDGGGRIRRTGCVGAVGMRVSGDASDFGGGGGCRSGKDPLSVERQRHFSVDFQRVCRRQGTRACVRVYTADANIVDSLA